jgi:hypothetical protein
MIAAERPLFRIWFLGPADVEDGALGKAPPGHSESTCCAASSREAL